MSSPLPTLQYLVAFQNNPTDDPALITTVASPAGTLGANNVWTDITAFVDSHQIKRGRQHELSQFEAGTCQLHLNNQDGRFSPWNTSSPYTGFLLPRKLVQVRATWSGTTYTRFTGHADAWPVEWGDPISQFASLHVTDAFRMLNLADITTSGYPSQVIADGAANYWRLNDPVNSTIAQDAVGGNYAYNSTSTPVVFGATGALPADPATAGNFGTNASDTGYAILRSATGLGATYTLEAWVYTATSWNGAAAGSRIIEFWDASLLNATIFEISNTGAPAIIQRQTGSNTTTTAGTIIGSGAWHHVAVTMSAGTAVFYIDGAAVSQTGGPPLNFSFTAAYVVLGAAIGAFGFTPSFGGNMQEVAYYTTALSAGTISNHFTLGTIPQQSTDARIARILNIIGWSSGARSLDAGYSNVQAVMSSLTTTSSLSHMQSVENTEGGALFMTGDGKVKFLSRQTLFGNSLYTTSQQTVGDNIAGGDMPLQPGPIIALDDIDLYNEASATRSGGNAQIFSDSTSITSYGRVTWNPPSTLLGISDIEVLGLTQYIVNKYKTPVVRITSISVDLIELIQPNLVAHLLSLDLLQQITVERTSPPDGHTAFSQTANIERIEENVTPTSWMVTFQLAKADPAWWVLGTAQLGTSTRVAY